MSIEDTVKRMDEKLDWVLESMEVLTRGQKKRELEDTAKEEAKASKRRKKEEEDYILVMVLSPQSHEIATIGPDMDQCDQEDIETKIECYKIPVSDLGKPGTPFAHCLTAQNVRDDFYRVGDAKDSYRCFDTLNTTQSVFELSRGRARYQVVFI